MIISLTVTIISHYELTTDGKLITDYDYWRSTPRKKSSTMVLIYPGLTKNDREWETLFVAPYSSHKITTSGDRSAFHPRHSISGDA